VLYIVHFTAFRLGGPFFSGHDVESLLSLIATRSCQPEPTDASGRIQLGLPLTSIFWSRVLNE